MSKQIAKLLKADISEGSDLMRIARMLEKKGRGNDTLLAHITKKEAQMLKDAGGSGTLNPDTGLLEFYEIPDSYAYGADYAQTQPAYDVQSFGGTEPSYAPDYSPASFANREPAQSAMNVASSQFQAPAQYSGIVPATELGPQTQAPFGLTPGGVPPVTPSTVAPTRAATELTGKTGEEKSFFDRMSDDQKTRLALAGGLGLFGAYQGRQAGKQAEARAGEIQALGKPYQAQGTELQRAAMAGELTPQSAQAYQALQARLAQGTEQRGGVGAAQAAAQAEAFRQQLLAQQYNLGLQVSNIGDNIAIGAIRTGMQADQQLSQVNNAFYTNLAAIAAGMPTRTA